jgi:hypothetical protein
MQFSPVLCYHLPISPNIFLNTLFSKSLSQYSSLNQRLRSPQQCIRSHSNIGLYSLEIELTRVVHEEGILDTKLNVHVGSPLEHCGNYTYRLQLH